MGCAESKRATQRSRREDITGLNPEDEWYVLLFRRVTIPKGTPKTDLNIMVWEVSRVEIHFRVFYVVLAGLSLLGRRWSQRCE